MDASSERTAWHIPIVTALVIAWSIAVWVGLTLGHASTQAAQARWGLVSTSEIYNGDYWGLVTNVFAHLSAIHLVFNLAWMWPLGSLFERRYGSIALAAFIVGSAFVSSSMQLVSGEAGLGLSGVVYALFGFGWISRDHLLEFEPVVTNGVIALFLVWGALCVVLPQFSFLRFPVIANVEHVSGLLFGATIAAGKIVPGLRQAGSILAGVMIFAATVPLGWNPRSVDWVAVQATKAEDRGDYQTAGGFYLEALGLGANPTWTWTCLARLYAKEGDDPRYEMAVRELRKVDGAR